MYLVMGVLENGYVPVALVTVIVVGPGTPVPVNVIVIPATPEPVQASFNGEGGTPCGIVFDEEAVHESEIGDVPLSVSQSWHRHTSIMI